MANVQDRGPPSVAAVAIATALVSATTGYFLGQARAIGVFGRSASQTEISLAPDDRAHDDDQSSDASSDEEAAQDLGELKAFPGSAEEHKLVLVVRTDLGMGKGESTTCPYPTSAVTSAAAGILCIVCLTPRPPVACFFSSIARMLIPASGKIAAQCSHATLACYKALIRADPAHPCLQRWERLGQAKVALKVDSEDDMLMLQAQAVSLGLCAQVIHDAGRTQIASGSATVLGIGPAPKSHIDQVTGHLKLL